MHNNQKVITLHPTFTMWDGAPKRVLLRADLNVPLTPAGTIANDFRLRAILPTLDYLLNEKKSTITLLAHLGRPNGHDQKLSTQVLTQWFNDRGYASLFAPDIATAHRLSTEKKAALIMLENVRFFAGEKRVDETLAREFASLGDYYVQDAFGAVHRDDTSMRLTALHYAPAQRSIGFLIEKELHALNRLLHQPSQPFVCIIGGGKVADKIPLLKNLLPHMNMLLLCPAIASTFLKAQGFAVGKSLVDDASIALCQEIIQRAQEQNVTLMLPLDYQIARDTQDGPLEITDVATIPANGIATSIGPHTVELFARAIAHAKTVFYNGQMGFPNRPDTLEGLREIIEAIAQSSAWSVIAGGDSVSMVEQMGYEQKINFLSTGGGAALAYLSGQKLPGLQPFLN